MVLLWAEALCIQTLMDFDKGVTCMGATLSSLLNFQHKNFLVFVAKINFVHMDANSHVRPPSTPSLPPTHTSTEMTMSSTDAFSFLSKQLNIASKSRRSGCEYEVMMEEEQAGFDMMVGVSARQVSETGHEWDTAYRPSSLQQALLFG
eukprot:1142394-Pelagomonas_calceolata.AAC.2